MAGLFKRTLSHIRTHARTLLRYAVFWKTRKPLNDRSGTLILLIGSSRSGKSHFINLVRGKGLSRAPSHENLSSEPDPTVQWIAHDHRRGHLSSRVVFIESPGFNNPWMKDTQITEMLQSWFQNHCSGDAKLGGILYFYDTWGERLKHGPLNDPPPMVPPLLRDTELAMRFTVVTTKWDRFSERHSINVREEKNNLEGTSICKVLKPRQNSGDQQGTSDYILHSRNNSESARKAIDRLLDLPPVPLKRLKILRPRAKTSSPVPPINGQVLDTSSIRSTPGAAPLPPITTTRSKASRTGGSYSRTSSNVPELSAEQAKISFPTLGGLLDSTPMPGRPVSSSPATAQPPSVPPASPSPGSLASSSDVGPSHPATRISREVAKTEDNFEPLVPTSSRVSPPTSFQASASASTPTIRALADSPPSISAAQPPVPVLDIPVNDTVDVLGPGETPHDQNCQLNSPAPSWNLPSTTSSPTSLSPLLWSSSSSATRPEASCPPGLSIPPLGYTSSNRSSRTSATESLETPTAGFRIGEPLWDAPSRSEKGPTPGSPSGSSASTPTRSHAWSPAEALRILKTDVIILVMGLEGSGKSAFINTLLPNHLPPMKVGEYDSLEPCTTAAEHRVLDMSTLSSSHGTPKDYRLVLVDTPGLNAREKLDSEILADIAKWSRDVVPEGGCRGGIVFLDDLSGFQRIRDSDLRAFEQDFEMVIATTNWATFRGSDLQPYHRAVSSRWSSSSIRAATHAFKGSTEDATAIVGDLLARVEPWGAPVDITAALDALSGRLQEKENQRRSVWETL